MRKDCGELRQEVERLRTGGGQEFQSLALTTLYRHVVGICKILDRLQVAVVILLCRIVVDCVER